MKPFVAKQKLLQGQYRIFTFFCKLSHVERERDLEKAQLLCIKRTNYSRQLFLLMSVFEEIFDQNSSFRWLLLTDSGVLEEIFVKNV
jgi:hypothetical protein